METQDRVAVLHAANAFHVVVSMMPAARERRQEPEDGDRVVDVSVLIVNYNVKDYLLQCLQSIATSAADVVVEVVVVDNASSDSSVAELRPHFPWVRWIALDENLGFGKGNNLGLQHCTGRYVLFLNPDTIIGHDTLAVMVAYLDGHPEVGMAGCKVLNGDGSFQLACRRGFPTPWASFCRLFGLQALFPSSPIFAQYNQTFRSIDETYPVDALIGAFMIGPRPLLVDLGGFDPAFFMYGEDLDLCYRVQQAGYRIMYVHTTSIVHFKGESTRRSSMNEVRVFYQAMEIFARKHFGGSMTFLALLRVGIVVRAVMARMFRHGRELVTMAADMVAINLALMLATWVRFDSVVGFPAYAYPTVFVVVTVVSLVSLVAVGEYVEYRPSVRRAWTGMMVAFFLLTPLTYFFKDYAFSRGVLLATIGVSCAALAGIRLLWAVRDATSRDGGGGRIVFVGLNEATLRIMQALQTAEHRHATIVGVVAHGSYAGDTYGGYPVLGTTDYLDKLVARFGVTEVIVTDPSLQHGEAMQYMVLCAKLHARFHLASAYDDIVTARIINDVAGIEPTVSLPPLVRFRNRTIKRTIDITVAIFVLIGLLPLLILRPSTRTGQGRRWTSVLRGRSSLVGLYPDTVRRTVGKPGITGLVHISTPAALSEAAIAHLNDFYVDRYSVALDVEILLKHLVQRIRGHQRNP